LTIFPKLYKVSSFLDISSFAKKILRIAMIIYSKKLPAVFAHIILFILIMILLLPSVIVFSKQENEPDGPPPASVRVADAEMKMVSRQIELVGTTSPVTESRVATEISGIVDYFPVKEGDFVSKGQILLRLRDKRLKLNLTGAIATRERIRANLEEAKKELDRMEKLKATQSVAERRYDTAYFLYQALLQELNKSKADIDLLEYEISQKNVLAPFSGLVAGKHTEIGEWVVAGGSVVDLIDLSIIEVLVDVPERFFVNLEPGNQVFVTVKSLFHEPMEEKIQAIFPKGDPSARTFTIKIAMNNPDMKIKGGMEAHVTFNLREEQKSLVVHKDAVVIAGKERLVFAVRNGFATPVPIVILEYFENSVAVEGDLKPGDKVVIRGNERLRPGQPVKVLES
jgi:RND family efflux transporter MFP subunit